MCRIIIISIFLLISATCILTEEDNIETTTRQETDSIDRVYHSHHENPTLKGIWKKKFVWKPRWVKTWKEQKIYVAVWKKMWGPVELTEWVPIPKPPPGWTKPSSTRYLSKKFTNKICTNRGKTKIK